MATPGHTPACVTYRVGEAAFVGDTLFMPDYGTARTDFPGGDARQLYRSMQRILALPRETRLFMCHDYKAPGRDAFAWETTVGEQIDRNVHIGGGVAEDAYVAMREARDATLSVPKLLYPSIQVNLRARAVAAGRSRWAAFLEDPAQRPGRFRPLAQSHQRSGLVTAVAVVDKADLAAVGARGEIGHVDRHRLGQEQMLLRVSRRGDRLAPTSQRPRRCASSRRMQPLLRSRSSCANRSLFGVSCR